MTSLGLSQVNWVIGSPQGCLHGAWSKLTLEYSGSKACSASMSAAVPPLFCTSAMACSANVVFPLLSGP